jgi:two-component system alkaline phosphatase synthesis response regulator PhoP
MNLENTQRRYRILIVDDEKGLVKIMRMNLEHDGFEVVEANNGAQAMDKLRATIPDLVLLDVMMPDMDGFTVLRMIREVGRTPVIMLTAKGEEADKVKGLELGADDYVTKPFSPRELTSRIRAVLRRGNFADEQDDGRIDVDGRLVIDFGRRQVFIHDEEVQLRPTEYRLLYHLVKNAGWVLTHDQILAKVWGYEYENEPHYVRLYINYLRKKLEENPAEPRYILTERGVGYRFVDYKRTDLRAENEPKS